MILYDSVPDIWRNDNRLMWVCNSKDLKDVIFGDYATLSLLKKSLNIRNAASPFKRLVEDGLGVDGDVLFHNGTPVFKNISMYGGLNDLEIECFYPFVDVWIVYGFLNDYRVFMFFESGSFYCIGGYSKFFEQVPNKKLAGVLVRLSRILV